jgi:hypothetical protein
VTAEEALERAALKAEEFGRFCGHGPEAELQTRVAQSIATAIRALGKERERLILREKIGAEIMNRKKDEDVLQLADRLIALVRDDPR